MTKQYNYDIRILIDKDLKQKVDKMRDDGINISQILRKFLKDYQFISK